jgi:hypothetical protein
MIDDGEELFRDNRDRFHVTLVVFTVVGGVVEECEDRFPALIR